MKYLGGKSRVAKHIAAAINLVRSPGQLVWDPFCGGLSVSRALGADGPVLSTDANAALISLYSAVASGWVPPVPVSREQWAAAKSLPDSDPLKAFCGFACSFGGIWFSRYLEPERSHVKGGSGRGATCTNRPHAAGARVVARDVKACGGQFECVDFNSIPPCPLDLILYLDPPYRGTTGYEAVRPFDHDLFLRRIRGWAKHVHVFVSEYALPVGFEIWRREMRTLLNGSANTGAVRAVDKLFYLPKGSNW